MRKISFVLCIAMILSCLCISVNAAENALDYETITSHDITISFTGTAGTVTITLEGVDDVNKIEATATLYYENSRGNLSRITSWTYDVGNELSATETFNGVSGRKYTVILEGDVYMGSTKEYVKDSATATCP